MSSTPLLSQARRLVGEDDFAAVLVLLIVAYVLSALTSGGVTRVVVPILYAVALFLAVVVCRPKRGTVRLIGLGVAVITLATVGAFAILPSGVAEGVLDASVAVSLLVALIIMLNRVLRVRVITGQTVAGALSAYLLIGMLFAAVYGVVAAHDPTGFFASGELADNRSLQYFSFTTLTTLGYGDLTAVGDSGRGLATLEAMVGQIFLATLVARLVSQMGRRPR